MRVWLFLIVSVILLSFTPEWVEASEAEIMSDSRLKNGKCEEMCVKGARKSIQAILHEVKNAQKTLDQMDNGARCHTIGQREIDYAKRRLAHKKNAVKTATRLLNQAQNARVSVSSTLNAANGNCNAFFDSLDWKRARHRVNHRKREVSRAKQMVQDARKNLSKAEKSARIARCNCKRRVTRQAKNALAQARKLTPERRRSILRETMVLCLGAGKSYKHCASKGLAAQYRKKLELRQTKLVTCFGCNAKAKSCKYVRSKAQRTPKAAPVAKNAVAVEARYTMHRDAVCTSTQGIFMTFNQNALWNMARAIYGEQVQAGTWDNMCKAACTKTGKRCKAFARFWKYGQAYCTLHSRSCSLRRNAKTKGDNFYVKH